MCAAFLRFEDGRIVEARLGIGGATDRPSRIAAAEAVLTGTDGGRSIVHEAGNIAAVTIVYEEVVYDNGGNILIGSLADYLVPTMADIPSIEIHHLATLTEASVTGAKGVGEGSTIGAPAAVLNAVSDALAPFGIGIFEMPITPQRILQLLREAGCEVQ